MRTFAIEVIGRHSHEVPSSGGQTTKISVTFHENGVSESVPFIFVYIPFVYRALSF
jgi:hypothetical protein